MAASVGIGVPVGIANIRIGTTLPRRRVGYPFRGRDDMNDNEIIALQRALRRRFFEGPQAVRWRPGRELVAQLLLYLDDPAACWRLTADWLRETLDADRVDGGFGGFVSAGGRRHDYVALAEAQRTDQPLPSVLGRVFDARDAGLMAVWNTPGLLTIANVAQSGEMTGAMRGALQDLGTSSKLAMPMRDGLLPIGMVCADWHRESPRWTAELCLEVARLVRESLGPLMSATARLGNEPLLLQAPALDAVPGLPDWEALTAAERKVAALAATGISYKEVARTLGRSLSTVDHQLRSIRQKLGVSSTARLVHLLSEHLEPRGPRSGA
jgi:DNA-binding CsgD family transcriptional regulator